MRRKFLLIISFFLLVANVFATEQNKPENPPKAAFENAAKRTTLIVLLNEDPKILLKLKNNSDDLATYKEDIAIFNMALKYAVEKYWKFTAKYEFHSLAEIKRMTMGKAAKSFVVLQWLKQTAQPISPNEPIEPSLPFKKLSNEEIWGCFELRLAEMMIAGKPCLLSIRTNYVAPSYLLDDVFSLQVMQYELYNHIEGLSDEDVKTNLAANAKILISKTLLIDKKDIDQEKFGEGRVDKSFYPFETQVANVDTIYNRLAEANPDYAYVRIIPNDKKELVHYLISCEDGVVCNMYVSKFEAKQKRKQRINTDALRGYAKNAK